MVRQVPKLAKKLTIDIEEIYIAALARNCKLRVFDIREQDGHSYYSVEITEGNGVIYTVTLCSNHFWSMW